jgi:hypothetical protein
MNALMLRIAAHEKLIPLSGTALRRGHDRGVGPIKIDKTNGTSPHILICMMVKVPAVLIVTMSYLTTIFYVERDEAVAGGFFGRVNYYSGGT